MVVRRGFGALAAVMVLLSATVPANAKEAGAPPGNADPVPELILAGEVGYTYVALDALANHGLIRPDERPMRDGAPVYGSALGVRVEPFTFGVRARFVDTRLFNQWSLGAEATFRPELGHFVPYAGLGVSYLHVSDIVGSEEDIERPDFALFHPHSFRGFGPRLIAGFDYRFAEVFSAGIATSGELLYLFRETVVVGDMAELGGSGIGGGAAVTAVLGLHI